MEKSESTNNQMVELDNPIINNLGEVVSVILGQSSAIQINRNRETEVYFHSNGLPGCFSVFDAQTGQLKFSKEIVGTEAVWAMVIGVDQCVYFASTSTGQLFKYIPDLMKIEIVGVVPIDTWVWDLVSAFDDKIYGVTYPSASLFEYCIKDKTFRDFGSISEQLYARGLGIDNEFIYIGIGTKRELYQINRHTGNKKEIVLDGYSGLPGTIEKIYSYGEKLFISVSTTEMIVYNQETQEIENKFNYNNLISEPNPKQSHLIYYKFEDKLYEYNLHTNKPHELQLNQSLPTTLRVNDMKWITSVNGETVLAIITQHGEYFHFNPESNQVNFIQLEIKETYVALQSLLAGKNELLYLGGYQRGIAAYDPNDYKRVLSIHHFPQTEGIAELNGNIYFGTYTGANIFCLDPSREIEVNKNPYLLYQVTNNQDRPFAMTTGENKLFVGTIPDYGLLGGSLAIYDENNQEWEQYDNLIPNQSIASIIYHKGLLYVTTSIYGGIGIEPTEDNAVIFIWDVNEREIKAIIKPEFPTIDENIPMLGGLTILDNGDILCLADKVIFKLDSQTYKIKQYHYVQHDNKYGSKWLPYRLVWSKDNKLYTTFKRQVTIIDPITLNYKIVDNRPTNNLVKAENNNLYFTSGKNLFELIIKHKK